MNKECCEDCIAENCSTCTFPDTDTGSYGMGSNFEMKTERCVICGVTNDIDCFHDDDPTKPQNHATYVSKHTKKYPNTYSIRNCREHN